MRLVGYIFKPHSTDKSKLIIGYKAKIRVYYKYIIHKPRELQGLNIMIIRRYLMIF